MPILAITFMTPSDKVSVYVWTFSVTSPFKRPLSTKFSIVRCARYGTTAFAPYPNKHAT